METTRLYEDENGYVHPCGNGYRVHWKNKKLKPDVNIKFTKLHEACHYLKSVAKPRKTIKMVQHNQQSV